MDAQGFSILEKLKNNKMDTLTEKEYGYLFSLFEDEDSTVIKEWLLSKWNQENANTGIDSDELDAVLQRIKIQINSEKVIGKDRNPNNRFEYYIHIFQRIAAVLFIPVAIFIAYMLVSGRVNLRNDDNMVVSILSTKSSQEYYSPAGTRSKVVLKDSTVVWLNSSSRLQVFDGYGGRERRVKLAGQAYFDVKKNPQSPFIVDLPHSNSIKVTGTIFTVGAYGDSRSIETVLISGSVLVNNGKEVVKMAPSQKVSINLANNNLSVSSVSDESYKSWKDGVLIFKEAPMAEVIATLEKWFNVSIEVQNSEVMSYKLTARLDNCSLTQVLDYMSLSSPITYNIKEQNVTLNIR